MVRSRLRAALVASAATLTTLAAAAHAQPQPAADSKHAAFFAQCAGTWDAVVEGNGETSKGTETIRIMGDGMWLVSDFQGEMGGQPFGGHGVSSWNPIQNKYVGVWADTMSPFLIHIEGEMDAAGKVMTSKGTMPDPQNPGQTIALDMVETWTGKDKRVFTLGVTAPDGTKMEMMKITYTRRK